MMKLIFGLSLFFCTIYISRSLPESPGMVDCSSEQNLSLKSGQRINISSPGFEDFHYPSDALCVWTIKGSSEPHAILLVDFILISIWPSFNCIFDGLVLFDGISSSAPVIGKYCSGTPLSPVKTSGRYLQILFYSGEYVPQQFRGFFLSVQELKPNVPCNQNQLTCHNKKCVANTLRCDQTDDCGDGTDEEMCENRVHRTAPCGLTPISPNLENEDRIVGGQRAIPGSWPWQCSLRKRKSPVFGHLCGAVLINEQWILTVAHCFRQLRNASEWSVHLGKFYKEKSEVSEQVRYIRNLFIHPKYKFMHLNSVLQESKEFDIALAKLNAPVLMTKYVNPVCLPPWRANTVAGTFSYVTGWGETLGTGNYDVLKQAAIPVVSKKYCRKAYEKIINITDSMICAGYNSGGHDSCKGDSGGPLVVKRRDRWFLIGLVSTGGSCASPMKPGIYTSVSYFKTWIWKTIEFF